MSILITLLIPVIILLTSARLLMTETYMNLEYNKPDFPPDFYGFTLQDRLHYGPYALQYALGSAGINFLSDLKKLDGSPLYNDRELAHMQDVQTAIHSAFAVLAGLLVVVIALGLFLSRIPDGRRALRQGLFGGGLLMLVVLAGLSLFVLLNWNTFFDQFHDLFFASGTWVFSYSDSLIRLYPVQFWQDAALTIGGLSAFMALLLLGVTWVWQRKSQRG